MRLRYAILGGGVLGLTAALRLAQRGHHVTLFEREPQPGGLAAGFPIPAAASAQPVWLDKFYHHLFRSDHEVISLIGEVGMGDQLEWRRPLTVTLREGHVYQLDSPLSLLRFSPISLVDRLRMGMGLAYLRFLPSPRPLEGKLAARWARDVMGAAGYESVWGPLLKGKFGAVADEISLPWFWARVHDRTAELGYIRGGFQRFYNRLASRVEELGGVLAFSTAVHEIKHTDFDAHASATDHLQVEYESASAQPQVATFDRVISTLPTRLTCQLTPQLPADYRARYDWGRAYGAHCLILSLDRSITNSYWMNINDPGYPFMVLVEHTNYMPSSDYGGRTLVYLGNYRSMDDPLFRASKEDILREFLPHLSRINPAFEPDWVQESWSFAAPFAQPIVTTDYPQHIPPFTTPIRGFYLANMFQVYPHDRGQNYSVDLAQRLVQSLDETEQ